MLTPHTLSRGGQCGTPQRALSPSKTFAALPHNHNCCQQWRPPQQQQQQQHTSSPSRPSASARPATVARLSVIAAASAATTAAPLMTCRRCKQRFSAAANTSCSCRFHPALYTGGEVAKAIGFVRASDAPEDQLERVFGRKGLMRFWDCCGLEDENAPGCCVGFHVSFDDELNDAKGWQ